ncbi:MAG: DNA-binding YbaB/EbfC family protein [Candidatus Marinamargulisbacteria bacterium]|jgi:DNA-binding YbaB/EbfC family protein
MFEGIKDMGKLLKQAKDMKSKMKEIQAELKKLVVEGIGLQGKVKVVLTGELECQSVTIDPSLLSVAESKNLSRGLLDAFNEAARKSKELATSKLSAVSSGLNLPGLD